VTFAVLRGDTPKWQTCTILPTFYHAQRRRRDQMNLLGSLKAYEDGLVLAGLLADDEGVIWLPAVKLIDRENPRVTLTVTRTEALP
jgi:Holliday junction resolvase RusA-like endonuclease